MKANASSIGHVDLEDLKLAVEVAAFRFGAGLQEIEVQGC